MTLWGVELRAGNAEGLALSAVEYLELLSVWEIAHRWHDVDQDATDPAKLPVPVKESMRELMFALNVCLNPYDAQSEEIQREYLWFGFPKTTFAKRLEADLNSGKFDKDFLQSTFIRRNELPKWLRTREIVLPSFWYSAAEVEQSRRAIEGPASKEVRAIAPKANTSEKARKAALKRHEPVQRIKDQLYEFYNASRESGRELSQAEAVRRFMDTCDPESLRLLSPTNAERTLKDALSKQLRGKRKR